MKLRIETDHGIFLDAENIQDKIYIQKFCKEACEGMQKYLNIDFKNVDSSGMSSWEDYEETKTADPRYEIGDIESLEIQNFQI